MQVQYQGNTDCFLNLCSTFLAILNLCYSTSPLDQGDSALAVCCLMLRASEPYTATQYCMIAFAMCSGFLDGTIVVADSILA